VHKLRELEVYRKSLDFTKAVRKVTGSFPRQEIFGFTNQSTRAAGSIVLNLAERARNSSGKEFSKFLDYSIRFGFECIGCTDFACSNGYISSEVHETLNCRTNEIIAMLVPCHSNSFKKSLDRDVIRNPLPFNSPLPNLGEGKGVRVKSRKT
jgi:four helix bundle protein